MSLMKSANTVVAAVMRRLTGKLVATENARMMREQFEFEPKISYP